MPRLSLLQQLLRMRVSHAERKGVKTLLQQQGKGNGRAKETPTPQLRPLGVNEEKGVDETGAGSICRILCCIGCDKAYERVPKKDNDTTRYIKGGFCTKCKEKDEAQQAKKAERAELDRRWEGRLAEIKKTARY